MSDSLPISQVDIASALATYLSTFTGRTIIVTDLQRISNGWESDVYAFRAPHWHVGERILRLYFGANAAPTALHEYRSLDLLGRLGYPVPQVDLVERSLQPLGRAFLIMERVEGVPLGERWKDPDEAVRQRATAQFCSLFATLHTLPWQHLPGAEHVPSFSIAQQLAYWVAYIAGHPSESFRLGMEWLQAASSQVVPQPLGLVHWDFHHENILVNRADRAWVIDWTQFQATDVRFDLAWTLMLLASERDLVTSEEVRSGYALQRGWDLAAMNAELRFFEAAACLKRLAVVLISLASGADAIGMRPGAEAVIGSRLPRFVTVYRRWLALTATPLPEIETLLAAHL